MNILAEFQGEHYKFALVSHYSNTKESLSGYDVTLPLHTGMRSFCASNECLKCEFRATTGDCRRPLTTQPEMFKLFNISIDAHPELFI